MWQPPPVSPIQDTEFGHQSAPSTAHTSSVDCHGVLADLLVCSQKLQRLRGAHNLCEDDVTQPDRPVLRSGPVLQLRAEADGLAVDEPLALVGLLGARRFGAPELLRYLSGSPRDDVVIADTAGCVRASWRPVAERAARLTASLWRAAISTTERGTFDAVPLHRHRSRKRPQWEISII